MGNTMTVESLLKRVENYPKGFQFTFPYWEMAEKLKQDCMRFAKIAIDKGLIKSVSIDAGWNPDGKFDCFQAETFERV